MKTYNYSKIKTYQICPKKYDYVYNQGIEAKSVHLYLGDFFHEILEAHYKNDFDGVQDVLSRYAQWSAQWQGDISNAAPGDADFLKHCYQRYVNFYCLQDAKEDIIAIEDEFSERIGKGICFNGRVDRLVYDISRQIYILRDTKTTTSKLKYKNDDVAYNQQLLIYIPYMEDKYKIKIDAIEIDEVRLCDIQPVPLNQNGKPSGDKSRLEFVLHEDYLKELNTQGLANQPEYRRTLEWLETRGHPMFNRQTVQVINPIAIQENAKDMQATIDVMEQGKYYRNKSKQCEWCDYRSLCKFDMGCSDETLREIEVNKLSTSI